MHSLRPDSHLTVFLSDGAIKRAKLEKTEPQITYEAFVADLAEGDSFTSSLIDVLVKVRTPAVVAAYLLTHL